MFVFSFSTDVQHWGLVLGCAQQVILLLQRGLNGKYWTMDLSYNTTFYMWRFLNQKPAITDLDLINVLSDLGCRV